MGEAETQGHGGEFRRWGVLGAGAWGTALAQVLVRAGRNVTLWAYEADLVEAINTRHENDLYLPGVALEPGLRATSDLAAMADADALLLVTPAQHLRRMAGGLRPFLRGGTPAIICSKGIEQGTGRLMAEMLAEALPQAVPAVLSGPSFAREVAEGLPTAVTLACADKEMAGKLARSIGLPTFRPYISSDLIGVEIGGAVKNVLAIACGIVDGKRFGASARAALTTRGFAELTRLALALGGRAETLAGLSGLGDLVLTCNSPQSRNMSLGMALGKGQVLAQVLGERISVAEGVFTATAVRDLARTKGIDMPIVEAVAAIVTGEASVDQSIDALLARPFTSES